MNVRQQSFQMKGKTEIMRSSHHAKTTKHFIECKDGKVCIIQLIKSKLPKLYPHDALISKVKSFALSGRA